MSLFGGMEHAGKFEQIARHALTVVRPSMFKKLHVGGRRVLLGRDHFAVVFGTALDEFLFRGDINKGDVVQWLE